MSTLRLKQIPSQLADRLGLAPTAAPPTHAQPASAEDARRERLKAVKRLHWQLSRDHPATFCRPDQQPKVALAVGIGRAIAAAYRDLPSKTRKVLLARYTRRRTYLALLVAGAVRVDLDGNPAGAVTEAEAAHAAEMLQQARGGAPTRGESDG
jgi:sRNA-binding protein